MQALFNLGLIFQSDNSRLSSPRDEEYCDSNEWYTVSSIGRVYARHKDEAEIHQSPSNGNEGVGGIHLATYSFIIIRASVFLYTARSAGLHYPLRS